MSNVFDFSKRRIDRTPSERGLVNLNSNVSADVSRLIQSSKYRFHTERLREYLDAGAEKFFVKLVQIGSVTIVNSGSDISFSSVLRVVDVSGTSITFPVDNFVRLIAPHPSEITLENLDTFLLESLETFSVRIGMTYEEDEEAISYEETILDPKTIFAFRPENLPVIADPKDPIERTYSCFFTDASHYVPSVTPEYFLKPQQISVLELMCLARIDYVDEGNDMDRTGYMELEYAEENRVHITRIPLGLVDTILAGAISRKSKIFDNLKPEDRIIKYATYHVYPQVNSLLYIDE